MPHWRLGTIGFGYSDWQGVFYPKDAKSPDYLSYYARHFDTLELDTTFHAAPTPERVRKWAAAVPEGFRFCVKTPKDITHAPPPLSRRTGQMLEFLDGLGPFGAKLGVVLLQFPPSFDAGDARDLERFLAALPADRRYALEMRHSSWNNDATAKLLGDHRCCRVAGDYFDEPWDVPPTTDFLYVRWIGEHERFEELNREQIDVAPNLEWWRGELGRVLSLGQVKDVFGFFNNDYSGYSIATCRRFMAMMGLPVKESPDQDLAGQGMLFG